MDMLCNIIKLKTLKCMTFDFQKNKGIKEHIIPIITKLIHHKALRDSGRFNVVIRGIHINDFETSTGKNIELLFVIKHCSLDLYLDLYFDDKQNCDSILWIAQVCGAKITEIQSVDIYGYRIQKMQ